MFNVKIKKSSLIVSNKEPIATGASKVYYVSFDFDEEWDGLLKNVIFKAGEASVAVLLEGTTCAIPWEVLSRENVGEKLWVGVYGSDTEGTKLPTVWNELEVIQAGAELCGSGSEPTPTAVSLIYEAAKNAEDMAKDAAEKASQISVYADRAEEAMDAAKTAATAASQSSGNAQIQAKLAFDEAERAKEEAETAKESARIASQNNADMKKQCANALRGRLYGVSVSADDVSPMEHELDVKITGENVEGIKVKRLGKNLLDLSLAYPEKELGSDISNGYRIKDNKIIIEQVDRFDNNGYTPLWRDWNVMLTFGELCPDLKVGDRITFHMKITNTRGTPKSYIYLHRWEYENNRVGYPLRNNMTATVSRSMLDSEVFMYASGWSGDVTTLSNIQVEIGETATEYEPYIEPIEAVADADGNVKGLMSRSPSMTLTTDNAGAVIECSYTKDTNKVIEQLTNAIISLGGNI